MTAPFPTDGLASLIFALANRAGATPVVEEIRSSPWASLSFSGARHRIALKFEGEESQGHARTMTEGIDHAEFDLGAHLLADIAVTESRFDETEAHLVIEALTIEND